MVFLRRYFSVERPLPTEARKDSESNFRAFLFATVRLPHARDVAKQSSSHRLWTSTSAEAFGAERRSRNGGSPRCAMPPWPHSLSSLMSAAGGHFGGGGALALGHEGLGRVHGP